VTEWHRFDYGDKPATAPKDDQMVWVRETDYERGVTVGVFDGFTFRMLPSGTDDCYVTHWAPMDRPEPPDDGWEGSEV
jgi:hypothetical protein